VNKSYKSIYNEALGAWVATSEISKGRGKKKTRLGGVALAVAISAGGMGIAVAGEFQTANASANAPESVAIGFAASAGGNQALALGFGAVANGWQSIAQGGGASTSAIRDTAIGNGASTASNDALAIGSGASVGSGNSWGSIAIGMNATVGDSSTAAVSIGRASKAGYYGTAVGSESESGQGSVAIGAVAKTTVWGVAIGEFATATASHSIATGVHTTATGDSAIAHGSFAVATGISSTAIGTSSTTSADTATAVGNGSVGAGVGATALGTQANAATVNSIAIGALAAATGPQAIAVGAGSQTSSSQSIGIGVDTRVASEESVAIGVNAQVAGGTADGSTALGAHTTIGAGASGAVAVGYGAMVTSTGGMALGANATVSGSESIAMGVDASTSAYQGMAIGREAKSDGTGATAIGRAASAIGTDNLAIGSSANANAGWGATAVGMNASATDVLATAVGHDATAGANSFAGGDGALAGTAGVAIGSGAAAPLSGGTALGNKAAAGNDAVATGNNARAYGDNSIVTGLSSTDNGVADSTVLGASASVNAGTAGRNVALGAQSVAARGARTGYKGFGRAATESSVGELSVGSTGNTRQITSVAAGQSATDAVNVAQLGDVGGVLATALGGGAAIDATTGALTAPAYTVGGVVRNNVGDALAATNALGVQYGANAAGGPTATVDLTKGGTIAPTVVSGVADGLLSTTSTQAVNGKQLNQTNADVSNLSTGATGLVRQSTIVAPITVGAKTLGSRVEFANSGGAARTLGGVAAGTLGATSTDAVNGSQLFGNTANVAAALGGGATASATTGALTAPAYSVGGVSRTNVGDALAATNALSVQYTPSATGSPTASVDLTKGGTIAPTVVSGVANGALNATSTQAVNGRQLNQTNTDVADLSQGLTGLVRQASATAPITVGAQTQGTIADFANSAGAARTLRGVARGQVSASSTDAVNGSQLFGSNGALAAALGGGASTDPTTGAVTAPAYNVGGVARNSVGDALAATNAMSVQYTPNAAGVPTAALDLTKGGTIAPTVVSGLADGALSTTSTQAVNGKQLNQTNTDVSDLSKGLTGLVRQSSSIAPITVGAQTQGTRVDFANASGISRSLQGVARGTLGATSTEAVNGAQLFETNTEVTNLTKGVSGFVRQASATAPITIGAQTQGTSLQIANSAGVARTLGGVAAGALGATSTEAVNGSQLFASNATVASALGGGAAVQPGTGALTAPSYAVGGVARTNVGDALAATNALGVQYTPSATGAPTAAVDLTKEGAIAPTVLSGLARGALNSTSTQAVNGAQLNETNDRVSTLTGAVNNGAAGPVQYSSSAAPTLPSNGVKSNDVTLVGGASGAVRMHNLAAGATTTGSSDAVNGGQLNTGLASVASALGGGSAYNPVNGKLDAPSYSVGGTTYNNAGDAFSRIDRSLASGDGIKYFHANSTLADSSASGFDATAAGPAAIAAGTASVAVGKNASASTDSAVAVGSGSSALGGRSVAVGAGGLAMGDGAVAVGDQNVASGTGAVALGAENVAQGQGAVALGNTSLANGVAALAMGVGSAAQGEATLALGNGAQAAAADAIAVGTHGSATAERSVAIGMNSSASVKDSVALGAGSSAARGAVGAYTAFGVGSGQNSAGEVAIGATGSERQLTHVAAGSAATDAANVGQLTGAVNGLGSAVTGVLGGKYDTATGAYTAPVYNVAGGTKQSTVQGAFDTYNTSIAALNSGGAGLLQYSSSTSPLVRNGGTPTNDMLLVGGATGAVRLHNVGAGAVTSGSTDAINGGQLNTALASVAAGLGGQATYDPVTGQVTAPNYTIGNTTYHSTGEALGAVDNAIAGGAGIKYFHARSTLGDSQAIGVDSVAVGPAAIAAYDGSVALGAGSQTGGAAPSGAAFGTRAAAPASEVSIGTSDALRRITNVAGGSSATDAVNVGQLGNVLSNLNTTFGQSVFDPLTGVAVAPSFSMQGKSYGDLTSAVGAIDKTLTAGNTAATNLAAAIDQGTVGLVQQVGGKGEGVLTIGAGTAGKVLDIAGTEGNRVLTGLAAGVGANDAATMAQLAAGNLVAANTWVTSNPAAYVAPVATGRNGLAVGSGAVSTGSNSVALGDGASDGGRRNVVSVGRVDGERQVTNVAAGTEDSDAVNAGQLRGLAGALGGGAAVMPDGTIKAPSYTVTEVRRDGTTVATTQSTVGGAIDSLSGSIGQLNGAVKTMASGGSTYMQTNSTGPGAKATGADSVAVGSSAVASGEDSLAIGTASSATDRNALAIGAGSSSTGAGSTALGSSASATHGGTAVGSGATTGVATAGTAIGNGARVVADSGVALGTGSVSDRVGMASAKEAVSDVAVSSTLGAISVGSAGSERQIVNIAGGTQATDAVNLRQLQAVQAGSAQYDRAGDGSVNYASLTLGNGQAPNGTVVSNVAPGVAGTDAVNVNQLNSAQTSNNGRIDATNARMDGLERNAYAGVASAMAVQMPGAYAPGKTVMRMGTAAFKGQGAMGVSFRRTSQDSAWSVTGGVGLSRAGAAATVGAEWIFN
jgi:autotransporter adhesin